MTEFFMEGENTALAIKKQAVFGGKYDPAVQRVRIVRFERRRYWNCQNPSMRIFDTSERTSLGLTVPAGTVNTFALPHAIPSFSISETSLPMQNAAAIPAGKGIARTDGIDDLQIRRRHSIKLSIHQRHCAGTVPGDKDVFRTFCT